MDNENEKPEANVEGTQTESAGTAELKKQLEEATGAARRWQADYVNFQARTSREREADRKYALEGLLRDLLPALDTVQQSIGQMMRAGATAGAVDAVRLVEKEILRVVARHGVKPMEATPTFDPALHDAIAAVETTEQPEGTIVELLRCGYWLHDRVLRPANVRVARKPE